MNITITARKFKARETLKDYIKDELKSLLKFNDSILSADVILSSQNSHDSIKKAEITLHIPGQTLVAAEESDDFAKCKLLVGWPRRVQFTSTLLDLLRASEIPCTSFDSR